MTAWVLLGRGRELKTLEALLTAVRAGESRALVLRGEPGVGKSALLEHLVERASGCRVARASGVQSEAELAFAGLHQLCGPLLACLEGIPPPQQSALRTAFGLSAGTPPDRLLVALSVLSLLSEAAEERPVVCVVDDVQWLDRASAEALAFVARRLLAESVALVFAARDSGAEHELAGMPELKIDGLRAPDARMLLGTVIVGPLDERVRDRIVAETRGNPLALLELPQGRTPAELAGGFALPGVVPLSGRIEDTFRHRLEALPPDTRRLLLVAAAEPSGDSALVLRAAERLGLGTATATPARRGGPARAGPARAAAASARPFGGLPRRDARGPPERARGAGGVDRSASSTPIAAPGTAPSRLPGRTPRSPPSSSAPRGARRRAAATPRRPRSWSAPPR